jgi:hypothetical protein
VSYPKGWRVKFRFVNDGSDGEVFALFPSEASAQRAARALRKRKREYTNVRITEVR